MPFYRRLCEMHSEVTEVQLAQLQRDCDVGEYDAVVISGSQWMLSEDEPSRELVAVIRSLRVPTLGICFGHQLLARAFGAEVRRGELVDRDETVRIELPWPLFDGLGASCVMRESHRELVVLESVRSIGWPVGASSASCSVEAIRHPELPLFGVQFHPERSGPQGERLFASFYRLAASHEN